LFDRYDSRIECCDFQFLEDTNVKITCWRNRGGRYKI